MMSLHASLSVCLSIGISQEPAGSSTIRTNRILCASFSDGGLVLLQWHSTAMYFWTTSGFFIMGSMATCRYSLSQLHHSMVLERFVLDNGPCQSLDK